MSSTVTAIKTTPQATLNTTPSPVPSGPVTASINFFVPPADGSPAQHIVDGAAGGKTVENYRSEAVTVALRDIRGAEDEFSVDQNAFAPLQNVQSDPSIDWDDDESIKTKYYPEVEKVLRAAVSMDGEIRKVVIFDHTIRVADPNAHREPVMAAHVDQTAISTARRVRRHTSEEEAEKLLQGRYRLINVWRPLTRGPVTSYPLGFASADSASSSDIEPIQHIYPNGYAGEHAGVKYNQDQMWHYWSRMTPDERLLLQCFDSNLGEKGGRTPHTAFVHPRTPSDAEPRKSIEVRALVFG
ncbi:methyltransferase [Zalerion maritima]|uniref:Methyltransferase n=1 Tax=Zalerion maritima TaxID=339359 RepID=A0AAD5RHT4_9PEZI|nr:methyltransferase [Zalerion maritima]